jgi:hypothetical protein
MGWCPQGFNRGPSRYEMLQSMYAADEISTEQFEKRVELLLRFGRMNEMCPPRPPKLSVDHSSWPVPAVNDLPERNLSLPIEERERLARELRDEEDIPSMEWVFKGLP